DGCRPQTCARYEHALTVGRIDGDRRLHESLRRKPVHVGVAVERESGAPWYLNAFLLEITADELCRFHKIRNDKGNALGTKLTQGFVTCFDRCGYLHLRACRANGLMHLVDTDRDGAGRTAETNDVEPRSRNEKSGCIQKMRCHCRERLKCRDRR